MRKFEAHITLDKQFEEQVKYPNITGYWRFSKIDGDPEFGGGTRCYLSATSDDFNDLMAKMYSMFGYLMAKNIRPMRCKIEEIKYDVKYSNWNKTQPPMFKPPICNGGPGHSHIRCPKHNTYHFNWHEDFPDGFNK